MNQPPNSLILLRSLQPSFFFRSETKLPFKVRDMCPLISVTPTPLLGRWDIFVALTPSERHAPDAGLWSADQVFSDARL